LYGRLGFAAGAFIPLRPLTHIPHSLSTLSSLFHSSLPFQSLSSLTLEVGPLNAARTSGEHCKLLPPSGPGGARPPKLYLMHFGRKILLVRAILRAHYVCVYGRCEASTVSVIYLLAFRPLLSKAVNQLPRIYNNK